MSLTLLALCLSSCTTYQFTARQTEINRRGIGTTDQRAKINVDYDKQVSATSNFQLTRKDAIAEAEYKCIEEFKIDVVVDPIYKVEFNPFKFKKNFRATIIGFAGKYEEKPNLLDDSKNYTIEEIEKYKLLYDPEFLPYYYSQPLPAGGDTYNYYIKSGAGAAAPAKSLSLPQLQIQPKGKKASRSVMLQNQRPMRPYRPISSDELRKAKQLRDAGIGMFVGGAAVAVGVGTPILICLRSDGAVEGGIACCTIGAASWFSGLLMMSVGAARYNLLKKSGNVDLSFNTGANGVGFGLTF